MLEEEFKKRLKEQGGSYLRINRTLQIVVITFTKSDDVFFLFANSEKRPDLQIIVYQNIDFECLWDNSEIVETLTGLFGENGVNVIQGHLKPYNFSPSLVLSTMILSESIFLVHYGHDPRIDGLSIGDEFFHDVKFTIRNIKREKQSKKIENTVDVLKRDVEAIPETFKFKTQILETTSRLGVEIQELHKRVDEEIGAFREIVGKSEKLQDWKMFSGDVDFLKRTHVNKETYNSEIKRLEDTINTRIDSIQNIKEAYDKVLSQQNEFMGQQAKVIEHQSSFINWIKYATILVPLAVVSVPIIELVLRHFLAIS